MGLFRFFRKKSDKEILNQVQDDMSVQDDTNIQDGINLQGENTTRIIPNSDPESIVSHKQEILNQAQDDMSVQDDINIQDGFIAPQSTPLLAKLKTGLSKTRKNFGGGIGRLLLGKKRIDEDLMDELETVLLSADLGIETTDMIIESLTQEVARKTLKDADALMAALKEKLHTLLNPCEKLLEIHKPDNGPFVILMVGVNGAGKTTTIGKLAKHMQHAGLNVMLAAGDTFRAAAVEQLQVWGERNDIPVIAQHTGADSASVIFDAMQAAKARNMDVLIADTAGRLHTKSNLMEELKKVVRVLKKVDPNAPHETMLVIDAGMGQNALKQAQQFHEAVNIDGITLTKLDGTAKGGMVFAIGHQLHIPIRFIGVGESIDDLREFEAKAFVDALF